MEGLQINSTRIDISRIARWPMYCLDHHGGTCHDLSEWKSFAFPSSLRFIDVQNSCIVHIAGAISSKYLALSYVWGRVPGTLQLGLDNLNRLSVKDGLTHNAASLPRTISDAISLTQSLGLRYLWVDQLCIIQDDLTDLKEQLQQMASIYANSYFTIIAADGKDATHGIPGIGSSPRSPPIEFNFAGLVKAVPKPQRESARELPIWHTRAWTFQERAVSPRTLIFTNESVYWQCRSDTWYEALGAEPDGLQPRIRFPTGSSVSWPSLSINLNPWPDIDQYSQLGTGYNTRNLSFESDGLNAFRAVITAMTKTFPGGFHFALPKFFFDIGMLWTRLSGRLRRRHDFPSWSWLGWSGDVHFPRGYSVQSGSMIPGQRPPSITINPLVDWYAIPAERNASPLRIDNSYHLWRADGFTLPHGWTKNWQQQYVHEKLPDCTFRYPFPVFPYPVEDTTDLFSHFLQFEAESCTMFLGSPLLEQPPGSPLDINLVDTSGTWAGVIESPFLSESEYITGSSYELIAISQGSTFKSLKDHTSQPPFPEMHSQRQIEEKYEFYNVLWVERVGEVAYRKAVGRVEGGAWRRQRVTVGVVKLG